ncbi:methionyl aminopeptidase [Anaeromicropila herbilytica]|uniref:Methionine aminopeptidase n=1 Tax=Anaeromicropila herbilytica TaxID=2785025 RepID=A0A7R7EJP4_9FIRM|nr:methionyl aminopeptidase [Anaeromicropila herbilytica]BCN30013.1 methionine aminopeptidase [Anaeromicropila herbilytica]
MRLGRNDLCWCNSHQKYKSCHLAFDQKIEEYADKGHMVPSHDMIKTKEQIEGIRKSGVINTSILDMVAENIKEGMSTEDINTLVHEFTISHGAIPATLGYNGYPKSVCTSINEEVCHGIPDKNRILKSGDIINVDVTTILDGYYADASRMFLIGDVSEDKKKLVTVTKECLDLGLEAAKPWRFLGDIGEVINAHATKNGYTIVREIGGHGVGIEFHEEPWVSHIGKRGTDILLVPGMIFTIEPMVNMGAPDVYEDADNGWTIYTEDGKCSAQFEYTVLITENGAEILTR